MFKERIPFGDVISDDKLMGKAWKQLSVPQQVILKAAYGLELETEAEHKAWAILNDSVFYDELYYPKTWNEVPYTAQEYSTIVGLIGRRSGKSHISCFAALYEIIFGGHLQYVREGQEVIVPYIAQDLPTARANMIYIKLFAEESPMLKKQIVTSNSNVIEFKNGIKVQPEPPQIKTGRGIAIPVVVLDEVGFWYKTSDSANPDFEVLRAVRASQIQFPNRKRFIISSPYTEEGILWKFSKAGTGGRNLPVSADRREFQNALVMQASTAAMENPILIKAGLDQTLIEEYAADPEGYVREYGARFVSAVGGFLSHESVRQAIAKGVKERKRKEVEAKQLVPFYVAAMDPAFRVDSWAFTIFHRDMGGRVIQDVLRVWTPDKKNKIRLDPAEVMAEIAGVCKEWGINIIYSDQYQLESLQQIALMYDIAIAGTDFTGRSKAQMFGSFKQMLEQNAVVLLDDERIYQQLTTIQKKMGAMGNVQISAPGNKHDDIACAIVLCVKVALNAFPRVRMEKRKEPSLFEQGLACIKRKQQALMAEEW